MLRLNNSSVSLNGSYYLKEMPTQHPLRVCAGIFYSVLLFSAKNITLYILFFLQSLGPKTLSLLRCHARRRRKEGLPSLNGGGCQPTANLL